MRCLISSCYAGNVDYLSCLKKAENIVVDQGEFFHKQTFKNRCEIYGANGKLSLIVPIQRKPGKNPIKDIKIDYSQRWQKIHWKSLESSYRSSPYFEYYEHHFAPFYLKEKPVFLIDFNRQILEGFFKILDIDVPIDYSLSYIDKKEDDVDIRNLIHPKKQPTAFFKGTRYYQVFEDKFGFIPNLSVYDLIFNEGPAYLQSI